MSMPGHHCLLKPGEDGLEILACSEQALFLNVFAGQNPVGKLLGNFFIVKDDLTDLQPSGTGDLAHASSLQVLCLVSRNTGRLLNAVRSTIPDTAGAPRYILLRLVEPPATDANPSAALGIEQERMLLASVIDRTRDFVGIADFNARGVLINPSGRDLLGIEQDFNVSELTLFDIFVPAEHELIRSDAIPFAHV